ncbi:MULTISPECIES: hypothetical protein [Streptomyces]|uniref:PH domain-containing protein n=2 Tax=Streptomyces TaxID=1883 RepID=A0A927GP36_STRGL|nr:MULTISPECIES: hypothetical protein [Streptomyces]MBD2830028.1 hypothetical protein [Streptomyces globisporus]KOG78801.1 hypothetical protein ADK33_25395 [Streptomyces griseus subsp. rhodochrous]KOU12265.1 hypothetical protein ADK88_02465 [Streptomyces sp. NRRL F-2295]KOU49890.1 hypothetical protein ADK56_16000 [Streptomyces sp. MMG1522]MBD3544830.1 hypothetical protein [Streptomyces sp. JV180]
MRRTEAARELGGFVREHRTDGGRRLRTAGALLVTGVVGLAFGIPVTVASIGTTDGAPELAGLLLGVGLIGLGLGVWRLTQALRTREQCFDVHERGLTHRVAGHATLIPWTDIEGIGAVTADDGRLLAEARGMGLRYTIALRDGRGLRVDTFTEDAKELAETIHRAVHLGELPRGRGRRP